MEESYGFVSIKRQRICRRDGKGLSKQIKEPLRSSTLFRLQSILSDIEDLKIDVITIIDVIVHDGKEDK